MSNLTYFGVLAPVLATELDRLRREFNLSKDDAYDRVSKCAKLLSDEYTARVRAPKLDFADDFLRLAYLYVHVAMNANALSRILEDRPLLTGMLAVKAEKEEKLRVCALAGGPGTELLALAKHFERMPVDNQFDLDIMFVDKCREWSGSWEALKESVCRSLRKSYGSIGKWPFIITDKYYPCDLTDTSALKGAKNIWNRDVYIMHSFLSELFHKDKGLSQFMEVVAAQAPSGARFIFVERAQMWTERVDEFAKRAGLKLEPSKKLRPGKDLDEDPAALGKFYEEMCNRDRSPRSNLNFVYRVGSKP